MTQCQPDPTSVLLADFFQHDDIQRLAKGAGAALSCPILILDEAFRVVAHCTPPDFDDEVFLKAADGGEISYEADSAIKASEALAKGACDYTRLAASPYPRRFSVLVNSGVQLGYLICVDIDGHLHDIEDSTWSTVETILSKQLFIETSRQGKPFETAEDILICLLDNGFSSEARFWLQASGTYLATFRPHAFALIDLSTCRSAAAGKHDLKGEIEMRFGDPHPFLYKDDALFFLKSAGEQQALESLVSRFELKAFVSDPIDSLYDLPSLYRTAHEALELMKDARYHRGRVCRLAQLREALLLKNLEGRCDLIPAKIRKLAAHDNERGTSYCETLYRYLTCGHSLKATCEALSTHRNTVLYRIRKMREEFDIDPDEPLAHADLLLGAAMALFRAQGPDFFVRDEGNQR